MPKDIANEIRMLRPTDPARPRPEDSGKSSFGHLLYRYLFFGWLFADLNLTRNVVELRAAWRHNREMRKYLPVYFRRWAVLFGVTFAAGWVCEQSLDTMALAACCYTGSCVAVPVMAVIAVAWIFLARREPL